MGKNKKKKKPAAKATVQNTVKKAVVVQEEKAASPCANKRINDKPKTTKDLINASKQNESKTKLFLVLAFFVPFLIMGVMFARADVFPFGDRQVMYSDCKQQYLPFLKEFQRKLQNGESLLYSWKNGLGSNFMAMIGYYIASPLNLLTVFVPAAYIREAMAVLMMIKIGCASLFMAIFLKHVYRRNDLSLVAFGCCYAFCDYIMGYYWNIMWLDSVALLPLVALGVYCVVNEGKYKLYVISLALAFVSSYYIGYMVCVFVVLWFIVVSVVKKSRLEEICSNILKMAGYSAIGIVMTLPVTLTSLIQLSDTVGADDTFPEKLEFYNNFMEMLANLLSFHKTTTMEGLPNIGSGVVCLLLIVIFVRAKEIDLREKVANLVLLAFLFVSLNVNSLDYIWHGFHFPNQIPYRFAFIFSFVLIAIAYRAFTVFVKLDKKDIIGMCVLTIAMVCISVFYIDSSLDKKTVIGSLLVAGFYILFMTLYEMNLLDRRMLTVFASLLIIVEMCVEANIGVNSVGTTSHDNYPENEEAVQEMLDYAEGQNSEDFYRIDQTAYSTKNDGMIYGYNGIGQFSSTSYSDVITFMARFGVISKRSSFQYMLTSPVTSMFLNVKYVVARDNYIGGETSLEKVSQASGSSVSLYENQYYLPIAYMANNDINSVGMVNDSVFETQNLVFKSATGLDEDVYTMLDPVDFRCISMDYSLTSEGMYSYTFANGASSGNISVVYEAPADGMLYAWANVKSNTTINVTSEKLTHTYNIDSQRYIFPIGEYKKGEKVTLGVDANTSGTNIIGVAYLNSDVLDEGYALLNDEAIQVTDWSSTSIEGTIDVKSDGTMCTSIPYEKGWKLYVDGEKVETTEVMEVFLAAELTAGTHEIKLVYSPTGFVPGVILAVIAFAVFIALCIYDFLKKRAGNTEANCLTEKRHGKA